MTSKLPQLSHILETILYTKSPEQSKDFYNNILGLRSLFESPRGNGYAIGTTNLLIFNLGETTEDVIDESKPNHLIPKHGPTKQLLDVLLDGSKESTDVEMHVTSLRQHYCFAVNRREDVERWETHLREYDVKMLGVKEWSRGGYSVYFEDPDGHIGEVASRGIWPNW